MSPWKNVFIEMPTALDTTDSLSMTEQGEHGAIETNKKKVKKTCKNQRKNKQYFIKSIRIIFQHIMFCPILCCYHGARLFVRQIFFVSVAISFLSKEFYFKQKHHL